MRHSLALLRGKIIDELSSDCRFVSRNFDSFVVCFIVSADIDIEETEW